MLVTEKEYERIKDYKTLNRKCSYCKHYNYNMFELGHEKKCTAKKIKLRLSNKAKKCELYSVDMRDYIINNKCNIPKKSTDLQTVTTLKSYDPRYGWINTFHYKE